MSDSTTDRLLFVLESHTQSYVHTQTGIPTSTLSYVARGVRELPMEYYDAVNSMFSRVVSDRLFAAGAPQHQSNRFVTDSITSIRDKMVFINSVADGITSQHIIRTAAQNDLTIDDTMSMFADEWDTIKQSVVQSMQKSERPLEEWAEKYPQSI